jgi:outer membrane receptor protein involved in Fe transport
VFQSWIRSALLIAVTCGFFAALPAYAQNLTVKSGLAPTLLSLDSGGFSAARDVLTTPLSNEYVNNLNLGMLFSPAKGLNVRAGAWRVGMQEQFPAALVMPDALITANGPKLFIDDSNLYAGVLEAPSITSTANPGQLARGVDLSASYVWESPRFGQFVVSTKATYLYNTARVDGLLDGPLPPATENTLLPKGTELQSSLMLTWQVGKHSASAVTHYFDSFEELGKLNLEQLNEIVGNMTTLDLQYGYNLKAGKEGQALLSVGVRNLFDARPDQFLEPRPGAIEQTGRVAYGTIKYQF